jgi:predicted component of type VI protein secretion system
LKIPGFSSLGPKTEENMRKATLALFATTILLFMTGCSSQSPVTSVAPTNPVPGVAPVGLTVTDDPPAGVLVLFFQLSITSASFQPGNVSLLSSSNPIPVNVTQLQADSAFLGSTNVAAGTYDSLTLTFANPQLTIYNGTGAAMGSCANNTVCQLTPTTTPLTLSFSSVPFPLTVTANQPVALQLDIHLNKIIQSDLSVNLAATNAVSVSELPSFPAGHPSSGLGRLVGTVQSLGTNQFTLQTPWGRTLTIDVNSSTTYNIPANAICGGLCNVACQGFGCLIVGDILKVRVSLQSDGSLLASEVDYIEGPGQQIYEGTIASLNTSGSNTTMNLILQNAGDSSTASSAPSLGGYASVTVPTTGVTYSVDAGSFTMPSVQTMGTFTSAGNLLAGQEVTVTPNGSVSTSTSSGSNWGLPTLTFTASSITLEPSQITGQITSVDASTSSFQISPMVNYFMPYLGISPGSWNPVALSVYATSQTTYEGLSQDSFSGLAVNNFVSVQGWLFPFTGASPTCVPCAVTYGVVVTETVRGLQIGSF